MNPADSDIDVVDFKKLKSSVVAKSGLVTAGISAETDLPVTKVGVDVAVALSLPNNVFASVKSAKKFSEYNFALNYAVLKDITLASLFTFAPGKGITSLTFGSLYKCNATTALKLKLNTAGIVKASVKQAFEKGTSAIVAGEIDVSNINAFKFGITTTMG